MPSRRSSVHLQHTLCSAVSATGVGVHSGCQVDLTLRPAPPGAGVVFERIDVVGVSGRIPARADAVCETRLGTVLSNPDGVTLSTVEHLMAVFCGLGVDNVIVEVDGPELPIMDGSCEPFVRLIDRAGRCSQAAPRQAIEILAPVVVTDGDKSAALMPSHSFEVAFEISFDDVAIGRQALELTVDEAAFRSELADNRTFGFLHEVEQLRAAGFARGGTMDNVVVIDGGAVLNPCGLRRSDEFVRHKILDAVGDLYLLGAPLIGRFEGRFSGHGLNNALARALMSQTPTWRRVELAPSLAHAV